MKEHLGIYSVHVQLKTLVFDPEFCTLKIYRIIFLPNVVLQPKNTESTKEIMSLYTNGNNSVLGKNAMNQKKKLAHEVFGIIEEEDKEDNNNSEGQEPNTF